MMRLLSLQKLAIKYSQTVKMMTNEKERPNLYDLFSRTGGCIASAIQPPWLNGVF